MILFFIHILLDPLAGQAAPSCELLYGNLSTIRASEAYVNRIDGPNGISTVGDTIHFYDATSGTTKLFKVENAEKIASAQWQNGKIALAIKRGGALVPAWLDTSTGKVKELGQTLEGAVTAMGAAPTFHGIVYGYSTRGVAFHPGAKKFLLAHQGRLRMVSADTGRAKNVIFPFDVKSVTSLESGKKLLVRGDRLSSIFDLATGQRIDLPASISENFRLSGQSMDHVYFTFAGKEGFEGRGLARVNVNSGAIDFYDTGKIEATNNEIRARAAYFPTKRPEAGMNQNLQVRDFTNGRQKVLEPEFSMVRSRLAVSSDGGRAVWTTPKHLKIYDQAADAIQEIPLPEKLFSSGLDITPDGSKVAIALNDAKTNEAFIQIHNLSNGTDVFHRIPVAGQLSGVRFTENPDVVAIGSIGGPGTFINLRRKPLAASPHGSKPASRGAFNLGDFARRGKLRLAEDAPAIEAFFREGRYRESPELAHQLLLGVLRESPLTFDQLLLEYPDLGTLLKKRQPNLAGFSSADRAHVQAATHRYLEQKLAFVETAETKVNPIFWQPLNLFGDLLRSLPAEFKADAVNKIAGSMSQKAFSDQFPGIFDQKLFKFAKQQVREWMGIESKHLTDLAVSREKDKLELVILGTQPIDGDPATATEFGFYAKKLSPITVSAEVPTGAVILEQNPSWTMNNQRYSGQVRVIAKEDIASIVPRDPAPDYASIWRDGKNNGAIVVGDNMGDPTDLLAEYFDYYRKAGFRFGREVPVTDMKGWMENGIRSGELDYMVKEAHSDGMDQSLFRFHTEGKFKVGKRRLPDGKEESIYIFVPNRDHRKTALIHNAEFGSWIRDREPKENAGQFLYFNTSCNSWQKGCNELEAASSRKLIVFASERMVDTFQNSEDSALRQMIDGVRNQKTYAEIRTAMMKDKEYEAKTGNTYKFPDEADFQTSLAEKIKRPLDIHLKVLDENGHEVHLDGGS